MNRELLVSCTRVSSTICAVPLSHCNCKGSDVPSTAQTKVTDWLRTTAALDGSIEGVTVMQRKQWQEGGWGRGGRIEEWRWKNEIEEERNQEERREIGKKNEKMNGC